MTRSYPWRLMLLLFLWGWSGEVWANDHKFRGYAETRYTYIYGVDLGDLCTGDLAKQLKIFCDPHILYNRILPSFLIPFGEKAKVRITANLVTSHFRLEREIKKIDDMLALQRLYFDLRTKYVDFRAGLQAIQWGPAQLFRLTAPYNPQDPTDLSAEIPGVWAINSYISYSATGGIRVGILAAPKPGQFLEFNGAVEYLRWNHTFGTTQVATTFLHDGANKKIVVGADVKGNLEIGFWIDAALYIPYEASSPDKMWVQGAVAVGVDYSFKVLESLYLMLQYYYTSAGISDPSKYPFKSEDGLKQLGQTILTQATQTGSAVNVTGIGFSTNFLGAHYLLFMGRLSILEDLSVSVFMLMNLLDPSAMLGPSVAWTFLNDFTLTVGAYFFLGPEGSEFNIGRIKLPQEVATALKGYPADGLAISPKFAVFGWLRYNF